MLDAILGVLKSSWSSVTTLGSRVRQALSDLMNYLISFFDVQMKAAAHIAEGGAYLLYWLLKYSGDLLIFFTFLGLNLIPRWALNVTTSITNWAVGRLNDLSNYLQGLYHSVLSWAQQQISSIIADAIAFKNWAQQEVNSILATLTWTYKLVAQLLTNPTVTAQWLLGALWTVGVRYVQDNAVAIGRWALGIAVAATIKAAGMLEDVIVEIL